MARKSTALAAPLTERVYPPCAHMDCKVGAKSRIQTPTGMANFCDIHYEQFFRDRADKFCRENGLDTHEKRIKFIKEKLRTGRMFRNIPIPMREPGEDEDFNLATQA